MLAGKNHVGSDLKRVLDEEAGQKGRTFDCDLIFGDVDGANIAGLERPRLNGEATLRIIIDLVFDLAC